MTTKSKLGKSKLGKSKLGNSKLGKSKLGKKVFQRSRRLPKGPQGGLELLLIHNVPSLGSQGDVVEVRHGYAQNYLLPQGLATVATDHHKRMVEKHRSQLLALENEELVMCPSSAGAPQSAS